MTAKKTDKPAGQDPPVQPSQGPLGAPQAPTTPGAQEDEALAEYVPDPLNTGPATSPGAPPETRGGKKK